MSNIISRLNDSDLCEIFVVFVLNECAIKLFRCFSIFSVVFLALILDSSPSGYRIM